MQPTISPDIHESLARLMAYLWDDEQIDYEAQGSPAGHIFEDVQRVAAWLHIVGNDQEKAS